MRSTELDELFNQAMTFSIAGKSESGRHESDVQAAARREANAAEHITLTKEGLTPGMRAACVQPFLAGILKWREIRDQFFVSVSPYKDKLEAEKLPASHRAEIENECAADIAKLNEQAMQDPKYANATRERQQSEDAYEAMVHRYGRQAKTFPLLPYLILMLGLGAVEWLVNASTFQANWGIPALSAGFTIVVALAVAFAAHEHGTVLKQREHWFGDDVDPRKKKWQLVRIGAATLALFVVIVWIGLERYQWGMNEVSRLGLGGGGRNLLGTESLISINVPQKVVMSIFANILVWILGSAIAYWTHDPDPEFSTAKKRRDKAVKRYRKLQAPVASRIRALEAKRDRALRELSNKIAAEGQFLTNLRKKIGQVKEKEESLIKSITSEAQRQVEEYVHFLIAEAAATNSNLTINKNGKLLSLKEFQGEQLTVGQDLFRRALT